MDASAGIETSDLLETLKRRGCRVTYATFMKWRQQGLIPTSFPKRRGLGRGMGRAEAQWPLVVLDQVEEICRLRQRRFRFDAIAVELWLLGYAVELQRVRQALGAEWERFLEPLEMYRYRRRKLLESVDTRRAIINKLAKRTARRTIPCFRELPPYTQRAAEDAWRVMLSSVLFGDPTDEGGEKDAQVTAALGFSANFASLFEGMDLRWLRGLLDKNALASVMESGNSAGDFLATARRQASVLKKIIELPESLLEGSPALAKRLQSLKSLLDSVPRAVWITILLLTLARAGDDPAFNALVDEIDSLLGDVQTHLTETSSTILARLLSAVQATLAPDLKEPQSRQVRGVQS